jgi:hypothetical protein
MHAFAGTCPGNANVHRELPILLGKLGEKAITSETSILVLMPCCKNKNK